MDRRECLIRSLFYISAFSRFKPLNSAKFDAVMSFGGTDVDAVSSSSSFTILFSSIVYIKKDCSFDSVSESHQLLLC